MAKEQDRTLARNDATVSPERLVAEVVLNRRRRYALYYVSGQSGPVSVEDLAVQVAAWERAATLDGRTPEGSMDGVTPDEGTTDDEVLTDETTAHDESVYASLRQYHLPYLESRGFVTYDSHGDRVTGNVDDPTVELFVTNDPRTTIAWHRVYLALTAVSALLLGLAQVGVPPLGGLRPLTVAALIVAMFAVASVGHWYDVRRSRRRNEEEPPDFLVSLEEELPTEKWERDCDEHNDTE